MNLLFFFGVLGAMLGLTNPDIQSPVMLAELDYYHLKGTIFVKKKDQTPQAVFSTAGLLGVGLRLTMTNREWPNLFYTLAYKRFPELDYDLNLTTLGMGYQAWRPHTTMQLAVGAEAGSAQFNVKKLRSFGKLEESLGWEIYATATNHFVFYNKLWQYSVRPAFRSYVFAFRGRHDIQDAFLEGKAGSLSIGLGTSFE